MLIKDSRIENGDGEVDNSGDPSSYGGAPNLLAKT